MRAYRKSSLGEGMGKGCLILVALAALPAAVMAQPTQENMRQFLSEYGACIVNREHDVARVAVLDGLSFDTKTREGRLLLQHECIDENVVRRVFQQFGGRLRIGDNTYRGAVADALVRREGASLTVSDFAAVPPLTYVGPWPVKTTDRNGYDLAPERIAAQQQRFDEKTAEVARGRLGECVVRAATAASRAALATSVNTPAELEAMQALAPALSQCLPTGQTVALDRMTLRGTLAVAYYRLASAAAGAAR